MDRTNRPESTVLVSYGEIGTKSREVRTKMARRLRDNVAAILDDRAVDAAVERRWSRLVIDAADADAAARAASDATGVVWARPAIPCSPEADAIRDALLSLAAGHGAEETFAVRANRAGPASAHPFTSRDLEVDGGDAVGGAAGAAVDLDDPDRTYRIDCRREDAFVSVRSYDGPGGLPLGTQGRAVALVSGGIDSPVAAWEAMRRGCRVVPVYVGLGDYGGADHEARVVETVRRLARYAPGEDTRLRIVPAGDVVETLMATVEDTRMLSLRRAMLRIGEAVAEREGAHSIVTGESIGQKSSQTADNLATTDAAVSLPVHRPLLTRDKTDIVAAARAIGTYEDSTLPVGCERVAPTHPETHATLAEVEAAEPDDLLDRAAVAVDRARVVDVADHTDSRP